MQSNDMTNDPFEIQQREALEQTEKRIEEIQVELLRQIAPLEKKKRALEEALRAYREVMESPATRVPESLNPKEIRGKSQKEILRLIASANNNILVVRSAIEMMKAANVFGNPETASASINSIVSRNPEFVRVEKGIYRISDMADKKQSARNRTSTGLRDAIKTLKDEDPSLTKNQVQEALIRKGFDFGNRMPGRAVSITWTMLGYGKEDMAQRPLMTLADDQ